MLSSALHCLADQKYLLYRQICRSTTKFIALFTGYTQPRSSIYETKMSQKTFYGPWERVPPTPELPQWNRAAVVLLNNVRLWFAEYGVSLGESSHPPVIFLHGGHSSSRWWGQQIEFIMNLPFTSIVVDTRGHGRSTDDITKPLTYKTMADDLVALLDFLQISKASFVGWSDGANTSIEMAMNFSSRVDRILSFGANSNPDQFDAVGAASSLTFPQVGSRLEPEYNEINPCPNYKQLAERIAQLQSTYPKWTAKSFSGIPTPYSIDEWPLVWISSGDREEAIPRNASRLIADMVCLKMLLWVSPLIFIDSQLRAAHSASCQPFWVCKISIPLHLINVIPVLCKIPILSTSCYKDFFNKRRSRGTFRLNFNALLRKKIAYLRFV